MTHVHAEINPQEPAPALVDHQPNRIDALPDELPRIGTFAAGLANDKPRPWSGKQLVGAQSGAVSRALPDEQPRIGSFATGLATDEPRPWSGKQLVGDRLGRRKVTAPARLAA